MRTSSKPFVLTVVTDGDEPVTSDFENRGFSLIYRQIHCH
ncbi:hypothetical protein L798_02966 [Zootermopsis nevadensis]|uniref:CUB domain-containing protein n=1 Tax=Zootermopsis nevadensis TaxID=136037 RepID=A0A067RCM4_ZOONE|nr:hypothetical protein L798_02966 [Zootermopsis nevadensis]